MGLFIGRELITLVSRTINDLYFVVAVNEATLPASSIVKALLGGFGTALIADNATPGPGVHPAETLDPLRVFKEWAARDLPMAWSERVLET